LRGKQSKTLSAANAIDLEVAIHCENDIGIEFFCEYDESRISKIHRKVVIFFDEVAAPQK